MKVELNPVSFRANSPDEVTNGVPIETNPLLEALKLDNEHATKSKNKVELFNYRLHDDNWSKSYEHSTNTLRVRFPNCYDGTEYNIYPNGKVVESNGWTSPTVILEKHEELGKFVEAMKNYQMKSVGEFVTNPQNKNSVGFGSTTVWDEFTKPAINITAQSQYASAAEKKFDKDVFANKIEISEQKPQTQPNVESLNNQPVVQGSQVAASKQKTTFKEKIANVWKFFTTFGRMTAAAAKGIGYGAVTAVTMLAGSWLFNTLPKAFTKDGPKLLEVIKHPINNIGKSGKIIAGISAVTVFAYHLIAGKLGANQKTAVIDHKLHVGHRDV